MIALSSAHSTAGFLWPDFEERNGIIVRVGVPAPEDQDLPNASAAEAFHSHTHILLEFRHSIPNIPHPSFDDVWIPDTSHPQFAMAWSLCQIAGKLWLARLSRLFPALRFRVYCTRLADPIVRFHVVRQGERPWYSDDEAREAIAAGDLRVFTN